MSKIGQELRRIRKAKGLSSKEVAEKVGLSTNRLLINESESSPDPKLSTIKALCHTYDVPLEALFMMLSKPSFNAEYEAYRSITVHAVIRNFLLIILLVVSSVNSKAQIKLEPLFKMGIYVSSSERIIDNNTGYTLTIPREEESIILDHKTQGNIDYYITLGARLNYKRIKLECRNKTYCSTNNFLSNKPYLGEFYLKLYYEKNKVKAGIEHLCIHPIMSENIDMNYNKRGGSNEVFFSYNL